MKKNLLNKLIIIGFIIFNSLSFGQTLEKTYFTNASNDRKKLNYAFNINGETIYYTLNWSTSEVVFYDSTHNIFKKVKVNIEPSYEMKELYFVTDKLFNSNSKIEFMIYSAPNNQSTSNIKLYDDEGNLLFDFGHTIGIELFKTANNEFKLLTLHQNEAFKFIYKVYSLSGTLSVDQESLLNKSVVLFPNPTSETLNIKNLKINGKVTILEIFTIQGKKVFSKKIKQNQAEISVNISHLNNGMYIYKIGDLSNKFLKK